MFSERYRTALTSFSEIRGDEVGCSRNVCASILRDARLALMLGLVRPAQPTKSLRVAMGTRTTFYPMRIDSPDLNLSRNEIFQLRPRAQTIDMLKMRI